MATASEFEEAFTWAISKLKKKYAFDIYDEEDISQEAWIIAEKGVSSYDSSKGVPLENFLYTHLNNRLFNFRRDNSIRIETNCQECKAQKKTCPRCVKRQKTNNIKLGILSPASIDSSPHPYDIPEYEDTIDKNSLIEAIEAALPANLVEDYLKFKDGVSLPHKKRQLILDFIRKVAIAKGHIDPEEENWSII